MSNLQNLIKKIYEDAENESEEIISEAKKKQKQMIEEQEIKANEKVQQFIRRAKSEAIQLKEQHISSAKIKVRDETLRAKGEVIERTLKIALEKLINIDDETYIQFLQNRLQNMKLKGTEKLIIPENKRHIVKQLTLPIEVAHYESVSSGFHIVDEQLIMNYSFSSMLSFYEDELQLLVARLLFHRQE